MHPSSNTKSILTTLLKGAGIAFLFIMPTAILAMDTDIFAINTVGSGQAPNVLIVLDNTSNWTRSSQQWPDGASQGQSEVNAIKAVLQGMKQNFNVGLMEFVTAGNSGDNGGYIRQAILPMGPTQDNGPANKTAFSDRLTTIYNNINSSDEKKSGQPYGNLMYDAYNYFAGRPPFSSSSSVLASLADSAGYITNYSLFKSPLSSANSCGITSTYIIFIGNPGSSGPSADDAANTAALSSLGGSTKQLELPNFTTSETSTTTTKELGLTPSCYSKLNFCSTASYAAECANYTTCVCSSKTTSSAGCPKGQLKYMVEGSLVTTTSTITLTNTSTVDNNPFNADEWARFMYQKGIPVAGGGNQTVATYTIDVYNAQPSDKHTALMMSMAKNAGGKYFAARNEQAIVDALKTIFSEIMAVNTTFASASLPISATNRAQNENQIYIGMFRPGIGGLPRWTGNLKRYKMANISGRTDLADVNGSLAVSTETGFISPCASSWWSTDSGNYWATVTDSNADPSPRIFITNAKTPGLSWMNAGDYVNLGKGLCDTGGANAYSDNPDGGTVEKGGAAQMLRNKTSRNIKTLSGTSLVDFNTSNVTALSANTTINDNIVNFIRGADVTGEINLTPSSNIRPTIHGDVIHSRPLPIDHGLDTGVVIYYGSNDGTYRAVKASDGSEIWSFVAPEFYSNLQGLLDNAPLISSSAPKKFFFDGATGLFNRASSDTNVGSTTWIYPTMRRGGRMVYAFDVSKPMEPALKWKVGCTNLNDDAGCTSTDPSFKYMGQTWSTPIITYLKGYLDSTPVVIFGGGYDTCEDSDVSPLTAGFCSSPKGAAIYILNADTGSLIKAFTTPITRSIAADISLVDVNYDGQVDLAYAADTGGNIYRINFSDPASDFKALKPIDWTISRAAYTNGAGRKFLFTPALLPYQNQVFLAIGSGDREHPLINNYPFTTPITNRFYVYLDDPTRTDAINLDGSNLLDHTNADNTDCDTMKISPGAVDVNDKAVYGWRMDLNQYGSGEQTVTSAIIQSGMVAFSTNRPVSSTSSCTYALGEARGYWVNLLNGSGAIGAESTESCGGSRSSIFIGGGLPPSPVTGTVNIDGHLTNVVIGAAQIDGGKSAPISGQKAKAKIKPNRKRTYWNASGDTR